MNVSEIDNIQLFVRFWRHKSAKAVLNVHNLIFLFLIAMEAGKLNLLSRGINSEIYRYGCSEQAVVLKMVPTSCSKESKHLMN